jgi:hypothetical protein
MNRNEDSQPSNLPTAAGLLRDRQAKLPELVAIVIQLLTSYTVPRLSAYWMTTLAA